MTKKKSERGFSLVELMTVVAIIGTVIAIALPRLDKARIESEAVALAADARLIQEAVANYQADGKVMGCDRAANSRGSVSEVCRPTGEDLAPYLPPGFLAKGTRGIAVEGGERQRGSVTITFSVFRGTAQGGVAGSQTRNTFGQGLPQVTFVTRTMDGLLTLRALRPLLTGGSFVKGDAERIASAAPNPRRAAAERALILARERLASAAAGTPAAATAQAQLERVQNVLAATPKTISQSAFSSFTYRFDL